jgi:hemoglobin
MKTLQIALRILVFALSTLFVPHVSAQQPNIQKPLYDRLGGLKGITLVVDDFIDRLVTNK